MGLPAVQVVRRRKSIFDGLLTGRVFGDSLNLRHFRRTDRQRHFVNQLTRRESRHFLAVHRDTFQRVIRQFADAELNRIGRRRFAVRRGNKDRSGTGDTTSLRQGDFLFVFLFVHQRVSQQRSGRRTIRQLYRVIRTSGIEIRHLADRVIARFVFVEIPNAGQFGVGTGGFLKLNLIGLRAFSVAGFNDDSGRFVRQVTVGDGDFRTRQGTSGEVRRLAARVRQTACATHCLYRRDRSGRFAERIILNVEVIRVKAFPFHIVDIQFLNSGRIDQLDIVHIERVALIQTVIGAVVRVVGGRENHIHRRRHFIAHVIDRHTNVNPVSVLFAFAPHTFGDLRHFLGSTAFVMVHGLAYIGLFIGTARRSTASVLCFVFLAFGDAFPGVIQEVEVLLTPLATGTFDPYGHGIRTVRPTDTALGTRRSLVDGSDTRQIRPGFA